MHARRQEFEAIPQAEKDKFYLEAHGEGVQTTLDKVENILQHYSIREDAFLESGKFLPLGVWSSKGFNAENIKKNAKPSDIQWHTALEE